MNEPTSIASLPDGTSRMTPEIQRWLLWLLVQKAGGSVTITNAEMESQKHGQLVLETTETGITLKGIVR